MVYEVRLASTEEKEKQIESLASYMDDWLETSRQYRTTFRSNFRRKLSKKTNLVCGKRDGNYFMTSAMFVKFLYVINAFMQFFILNNFLGKEFGLFGFEVFNRLVNDNADDIKTSPRFPRVTLCDFQIRQMQNVQSWTVQCVLPINLFNEKIFLFLWFWLLVLCILSFISLCTSSYTMIFPLKRMTYIKKCLKLRHVYTGRKDERKALTQFVYSYLKCDGFYVILVVGRNGTQMLASHLLEKLYKIYQTTHGSMKHLNGEPIIVEYK